MVPEHLSRITDENLDCVFIENTLVFIRPPKFLSFFTFTKPVKPNEVANDFLFLKKNEQQVTAGR